MSKIHELKTVQPFFDQITSGNKKYELRKNDRDFKVNDILILHHYDPINMRILSGDNVAVRITGILENFVGLEIGYCILSISESI